MSFPRKRESRKFNQPLDPRFRGDDLVRVSLGTEARRVRLTAPITRRHGIIREAGLPQNMRDRLYRHLGALSELPRTRQ